MTIHKVFRFPESITGRALLIFVLAMAVRLMLAGLRHSWTDLMRAEMEREAISFVQTGVLGNPYLLPTGSSAHVCPGYALLLSSIFYVFGTGQAGEAMKVLLTCVISSLQYALLPWFGKVLRLPSGIGISAGLFGALFPLYPYIETQGDFENHVTALLLLLLIAWTELAISRAWMLQDGVALGLFAGLCVLTSSTLAPLCVLALAYIGYRQSRIPGGRPSAAMLALAVTLLCVAPWALRNLIQLGSPITTRSNFGMEFYLANNDVASPLMEQNEDLYTCCHPLKNADEARKIQRVGEVAYNRQLLERAKRWVRSHPAHFIQLTLQHIWFTWVPSAPEWPRKLIFRSMTPLSLLGLFVVWGTRPRSALLLAAPLFLYPLPYYLTQVHLRYRYPTEFILLVTASATGMAGWNLIRDRVEQRSQPLSSA